MDSLMVTREQVAAEAAQWFVRLCDPQIQQSERDEFASWLLRSPMHIEEYLALAKCWSRITVPDEDELSTENLIREARAEPPANVVTLHPDIGDVPLHDRASERKPVRLGWRMASAVASLAVIAVITMVTGTWSDPGRVSTAIGEQRSLVLDDGSTLYLNTDSSVRIAMGAKERRVMLTRGEAQFEVAKDPRRPFLVSTSQATVRAIGTVFNVHAAPQRTMVTVIEGHVEVMRPPGSPADPVSNESVEIPQMIHLVDLHAGENVTVTHSGAVMPEAGPAVERARAWTERRLVFRNESLADVVAEYNRYLSQPLRIDDPQRAGLRINGTFNAGDPRSLIEYLERYEGVQVDTESNGTRVIH